jgi:hypothetical protein
MAQPLPESMTGDLLDLFQRSVPCTEMAAFDTGHARPLSAWVAAWLMVYQRLRQDAPLSVATAEMALGPTAGRLPDCKRTRDGALSVNTGSYSQARRDLPVAAAERALEMASAAVIADRGLSWDGRRVFLLDGTSLSLGHHPELVEAFPPATNQHGESHWPVIRLVVAHEVGSGLALRPHWGPMYGPEAVSETELARRALDRLGGPAMLIYDRNFGIFSMTCAAVGAGHGVLARMTDKRFASLVRGAAGLGPGQWAVSWRPSRWDLRNNPELPADAVVRGRLVEVILEHEGRAVILRLFTTDMTTSPEALAAWYKRRWSVEGDIKSLKQTLAMERISGRSADIVLGAVAYNLVNEVRRLAAARAGVQPRRLSFARILHLVQVYCGATGSVRSPDDQERRFEKLLKAAGQCRHAVRERFRSYPREVIPRRRRFPERKRGVVNIKSK